MRVRCSAVLPLLPLVLACSGGETAQQAVPDQPVADAASVRQAIETNKQTLIAAFKAGDAAAAAAVYAPDGMVMPPNEAIMRGSQAIAQGLGGMFQQVSMPAMTMTISDLTVSGDHAFENGTYEWTVQPKAPGAPAMPDKGKYLSVWQKQADGSWKLLRDIWNTDTPAQH